MEVRITKPIGMYLNLVLEQKPNGPLRPDVVDAASFWPGSGDVPAQVPTPSTSAPLVTTRVDAPDTIVLILFHDGEIIRKPIRA